MRSIVHRGFTLIELLVAMAIAAILLVLAVPGYSTWLADSQVQNGVQSLAGGLRFAQAEAVKRNDKIQLVLDPTTGSGGWSVQQTDGTELQGSHFAEGAANLAFVTSPATLTKVTFNGLGMVDAKNADTTLPFDTVDVSSSVTGTHPLRILVGGARTGIKICNTDYTWPDPKACPP